MLLKILLVGVGGAAGAIARWGGTMLTVRLVGKPAADAFPYGTLAVNILGCLLIGAFYGAITTEHGLRVRDEWRLLLIVGLLGGFTTFSAFAQETLVLLAERQHIRAAAYVALSNGMGLAAAWAGFRAAQRIAFG